MVEVKPDIVAVFSEALAHRTGQDREHFLNQVCRNDTDLRERLDHLIRAHDEAGSFLGGPATPEPAIAEGAGSVIGPYKLLQQIGEGGMGVVFMAEQTEPVQRKVALKIIKPGMDTRQVIARFEAERQALAMMDHPNIAKVLDAGTTGDRVRNTECEVRDQQVSSSATSNSELRAPHLGAGRPYFVMELVKGVPITTYCDEKHLTLNERLELFVSVCQAVQHAHQKGVIHRDLKPSNILVAEYDEDRVAKIIDFGVAKAIEQRLTEKTMFTEFGQIIGTIDYMSPEQAKLNQLDIDTRSDIYSLGVLLYELLTGETPFDRKRLQSSAFDEMLRMIREEEPLCPSTRLTTLAQGTLSTICERRRISPRELGQRIHGELDWIVMKALDKDRGRRYETANGLARDLQRHLADEPVEAGPPSNWYRVQKFVRRNKGVVTTAMAVISAVVVAVVSLTVTNVMIRQEQTRTNDQKDRAQRAQELAEDRAEEIRQGIERLKGANALLDRGRWYVAERRWDDAHAAFTNALEMRADHVPVCVERADLYTRLGLWDLAAADFARELELREPDTTARWYRHALLRLHVGDSDGYRDACRKMRNRFRGTLKSMFVEEYVRSSLLAPDPGVDVPRLVELAKKVAVHQPWSGLYVLGLAHYRAGQYELAIERLHQAQLAQPQWPIRLLCHPVLAMAYHRLGKMAEARQELDLARDNVNRWNQERYDGHGEEWIHHQGAIADWPVPWWDYLEGHLTYREAKLLIDGSPPPDDARLHVLRARALAGLRRPSKAADEYAAALQLSPNDPQIQFEAIRNQGNCFVDLRQWREAAEQFAKSCELQHDDSYLWRFCAVAWFVSGDQTAYRQCCRAMFDRFKHAQGGTAAANTLMACLLENDALPDMADLLPLSRAAEPIWHWGTWVRGAALYRAGKYEESIRCFDEEAKTYLPRAWDWCFLAMAHHRLGHYDQARHCLAEARRWIDEANRQQGDDLSDMRPAWGDWHEAVVYPILLREAAHLLNREPGVVDQPPHKS